MLGCVHLIRTMQMHGGLEGGQHAEFVGFHRVIFGFSDASDLLLFLGFPTHRISEGSSDFTVLFLGFRTASTIDLWISRVIFEVSCTM